MAVCAKIIELIIAACGFHAFPAKTSENANHFLEDLWTREYLVIVAQIPNDLIFTIRNSLELRTYISV